MSKTRAAIRHTMVLIAAISLSACFEDDSGEPDDPSSVDGLAIEITNPGSTNAIETHDIVVNISGTVDSEMEILSVDWQNDRGGKGIANGKEKWVTGNIVLQLGTNNITIKAKDIEGKSVSRMLTVERENTTATGGDVGPTAPVVMYSYSSDLRNAAPVADASILPKPVYLFVQPGSGWQSRGIDTITVLCCKGQAGPGQGESYGPAATLSDAPYSSLFDLTGLQAGGTRRVEIRATFTDGTRSDNPVFDFTVADINAGGNTAPAISGSPINIATAGNQYNFRPTATDADGDTIAFSIENRPPWASFDGTSGRLFGTPDVNDVGEYGAIVISVSDGNATTSLPAFSIMVDSTATGAATLSWSTPTERTDNTPLDDLAGFNVYYGQTSGDYGNVKTLTNPGITRYLVENLSGGTWYFVITAVDASGVESNPSNEGSKTF